MSNNRGKSAAERLLGAGKEDTNPTKATTSNEKELKTTHEHIVMNNKVTAKEMLIVFGSIQSLQML